MKMCAKKMIFMLLFAVTLTFDLKFAFPITHVQGLDFTKCDVSMAFQFPFKWYRLDRWTNWQTNDVQCFKQPPREGRIIIFL